MIPVNKILKDSFKHIDQMPYSLPQSVYLNVSHKDIEEALKRGRFTYVDNEMSLADFQKRQKEAESSD